MLYEEVMLLALKDMKGSAYSSATHYRFALGGAILAELIFSKAIELEGSGKRKTVRPVASKNTGDPILDECLERIRNSKRRSGAQVWVRKFSGLSRLKHRIARQLCRKRILREDEKKVLLFFTYKVYPEIDPRPERKIIDKLRKAIFTDSRNVDPRTIILVSLANVTGLLKANFDNRELRKRKKRIKGLTEGEFIGKAAKEAVEAMQAALMAAVIVPAVASAGAGAN